TRSSTTSMVTSPDRLRQRPPHPDAAEETQQRNPISLWLRILLIVGAFTAFLLVAGGVRYGFQQAQATSRLERVQAQIEENDPDWKIEDILQTRVDPPDSKNSARVVVALKRMLPRDFPNPKFYEAFEDVQSPHLLRPEQHAL